MKKKMKSKNSLMRRIKITAGGKILHGRTFKRHLRRNKSSSQKRMMRRTFKFSPAWEKKIKNFVGGI